MMKKVYKFGTYYGSEHVFSLFKKHSIVFIGDDTATWEPYLKQVREGDIVMVCEGFQCVAVGEVKTPAADIRLFDLQEDEKLQKLTNDDFPVIGCKVELYILEEDDAEGFVYQKQGRFCCVEKEEIREKAQSLLHKYQTHASGGIFNWATGELSQDAMLCWIFDSVRLHTSVEPLARDLLAKMGIPADAKVTEMNVCRQYCHIDILLSFKVNGEPKVIIIEDKINAAVYNDIQGYCDQVVKWGLPNGEHPAAEQIHPCILRTGDGNERWENREMTYPIMGRRDILEVLHTHGAIVRQNDMLKGFAEMLTMWEKSYQSFMQEDGTHMNREVLSENAWSPWKGLYDRLLEERVIRAWHYVPNANGGFMCGQTYDAGEWDNFNHCLYMQFNSVSKKLCLMLGEVYKDHSAVRTEIVNKLAAYSQEHGGIGELWKKPDRYGCGTYMAYAVMPMDVWLKETWEETLRFLQDVTQWHHDFAVWATSAK